jgi:hypothetical protein
MFTMGELTFFLSIQVKQMKQGIFVHQAKYTKELMKKFNIAKLKPMYTLMSMATSLDPDENGESADQREYRSMIGSLLYLTAIRSDIQFTVYLCACFQASHALHIGLLFIRFLGISITNSSLGFGILLLLHLILLAFPMLILRVVGLTKRALLLLVIFSDLLLCASLLKNNL